MGDKLVRALAAGGAVRVLVADVSECAEHAARVHGLGGGSVELVAVAMAASALMTAHIKGEERITLQVQAERPRFGFVGDADGTGGLRARFTPPLVTGGADTLVDGVMLAIKHDAHRELYRGHTEIVHQTLEQALAGHLRSSSQVDALLRLGREVFDDGAVVSAGVLVERLPEHPEHPSLDPEAFAARFRDLGRTAADLATEVAFGHLMGEPIEILSIRPLEWRCTCSRERVASMLHSLGHAELRAMIDEDHGAVIDCHFCGQEYAFDEAELEALAATDP